MTRDPVWLLYMLLEMLRKLRRRIHRLVMLLLLTVLATIAAIVWGSVQAQGSSSWYEMRQWLVLVAR